MRTFVNCLDLFLSKSVASNQNHIFDTCQESPWTMINFQKNLNDKQFLLVEAVARSAIALFERNGYNLESDSKGRKYFSDVKAELLKIRKSYIIIFPRISRGYSEVWKQTALGAHYFRCIDSCWLGHYMRNW